VLLHGYAEWGEGLLPRLDGMFAFAVWDGRERSWLLARDRMGQKPLYYVHRPGLFAFASEPKALLEHPGVARRLAPRALASYLAFEYVPSPDCIFEGIRKLLPGHLLRVCGDRSVAEPWWTFPSRAEAEAAEAEASEPPAASDAEWIVRLRERLGEAVERQLVADVPLGCFLSGGLDSSAVAALMAERLGGRRVRTFAIGFTDPSFDEVPYAEAVARRIGAEHHARVFDAEALLELLPVVSAFMDEPLGDGSVLPTFALARFARAHVTVALSGDGGDELLGGYPTLFADRWATHYRRFVPAPLHELLAALAGRLPVSHRDMSPVFKLRQFLRAARRPLEERHIGWVGSFLPEEIGPLLQPGLRDAALAETPYAPAYQALASGPERHGLDRLLFLYSRLYLADDVLVKVDRTTMAASLEARSPFLDRDFIRFAAALPSHLKVRGSQTKIALRRAFEATLPAHIVARRKKGFGMPVGLWLRGPLRATLLEQLDAGRLRRQGIFEPEPVTRMVREHLDGRRDWRKQLWTLLAFQLWHERHLERAS
jgi:asparagine synthase (glutamine-hydrolysing)